METNNGITDTENYNPSRTNGTNIVVNENRHFAINAGEFGG